MTKPVRRQSGNLSLLRDEGASQSAHLPLTLILESIRPMFHDTNTQASANKHPQWGDDEIARS